MDRLISLCMIVKDEESVLSRLLDSVKSGVDEIVIVDTGSTDATKEIAARYTDKIFDFVWTDDFAAARNFSFSKATCEYAMWLDADDYVDSENLERLMKLRKQLAENPVDGVYCRYDVAFDEKGNPTYYFFRERILKMSTSPVWVGCVHECIVPGKNVEFSDFTVKHLRSDKPRGKRNLDIYQKNISKGLQLDARNLFYYGRELFNHKLYLEAEAVLKKMIYSDEGWFVNKIEACKVLADCYTVMKNEQKALEILYKSFDFGPPRASVLCKIGHIFRAQKKWEQAIFWYSNALNCKNYSYLGDFESPDTRGITPLIYLTQCYYFCGNTEKSLECHKAAADINPDDPSVVYNDKFFKSKNLL